MKHFYQSLLKFALSICLLSSLTLTTHAGIRPFVATFDTDALNKGDFELEQWMWTLQNEKQTRTVGWLWMGPVYGLTNNVEIAMPWEMIVTPTGTQLTNFTTEARIRLYNPSSHEGPLRFLLRLFYQQNFQRPANNLRVTNPWAGANIIMSYGDIHGSHLTLDIGYIRDVSFLDKYLAISTMGLAYAHSFQKHYTVGAEYYHEVAAGTFDQDLQRHYLGPNFSFKRGQMWATFGALMGLSDKTPEALTRVIIGVSI
jgi:hypothetical protein